MPIPCLNIPPCVPAANTYSIFAGKKEVIDVLIRVPSDERLYSSMHILTFILYISLRKTIYVLETNEQDHVQKKVPKVIESVEEIMRVDEVSSEFNRLCCRPYHPLKLEFKQYIPLWGDSTKSDYEHLDQKETKGIRESFNQWKSGQSVGSLQLGIKDLYDAQPVLFTMVCIVSMLRL